MTTDSSARPDNARQAAVARAAKAWTDSLIDRSRRNNLLYFAWPRSGCLDLSKAPADRLDALLTGQEVTVADLAPEVPPQDVTRILRQMTRRARSNADEKGLSTLFVAFGMATWSPADEGRPAESPVLLLPVTVSWRGREGASARLSRAGDLQVNTVLLFELSEAHGVSLAPDVALPENGAESLDRAEAWQRIRTAASGVPGFGLKEAAVLGNFSFQKMAMVQDLREHGASLAANDVVAAIAGDSSAAAALKAAGRPFDPGALDRIPADNEFLVVDADGSQRSAIEAVLQEWSTVIHGPPGTGKSQTICNLIASLVAQGRRVLFVAEKRAALEVVLNRLQKAGLGHLALDLHGADVSRRVVMDRLRTALSLMKQAADVDASEVHAAHDRRRDALNRHVEAMHRKRSPSGQSVYEMLGELLAAPPDGRLQARWTGAALQRLDATAVQDILGQLEQIAGLEDLRDSASPWAAAQLTDASGVPALLEDIRRLSRETLPRTLAASASLAAEMGVPEPASLAQAVAQAGAAGEANSLLATYHPDVFASAPARLAAALAPAQGGALTSLWAGAFNGDYRSAAATLKALRRSPADNATLAREAAEAARVADAWERLQPGAVPRPTAAATDAGAFATEAMTALKRLTPVLGQGDLTAMAPRTLAPLLEALASDEATPLRVPHLRAAEARLRALGLEPLLEEASNAGIPSSALGGAFRLAWLSSCLSEALASEPALGGFSGRQQDEVVADFDRLDRERLALASARVRREHAVRTIGAMNANPDQDGVVRRELEKKRNAMPLRTMLQRAPEVLTALCPCWMASPLSVAQLIPADRRYFDVVIFDEASQVLPEDAIPAITRGGQLVVAGDHHQLPPTVFFADQAEGGEPENEDVEGFESLLHIVKPYFREEYLRIHYRSRDESLIAFSNANVYKPEGEEMVTFPGPGGPPVLNHVLVERSTSSEAETDTSGEEVKRVVELIIEHAEKRPGDSLGVIAMGIKHADRIQAALDEALDARTELDAFFSPQNPEPFFVKNLERVQGDERDAIILSVGYGKDAGGRLLYRFGPLNEREGGGYRRLNVAVTRSKKRMTLVSSFTHRDMDPAKCTARGIELLRLYLEYAAAGGSVVNPDGAGAVAGGFEHAVAASLREGGMEGDLHFGVSRYRIDVALRQPGEPDRHVLAVECDGDTYRSALIARERDRTRPNVLKGLGWRFLRLWALDWHNNPGAEQRRLKDAITAEVAAAVPPPITDKIPTPPSPPPEPIVAAPVPSDAPIPAAQPLPAPPPQDGSLAGAVAPRGPKPGIGRRSSIDRYHWTELDAVVSWVVSDGANRTDEEIVEETADYLGFKRRGERIEGALRESVNRLRNLGRID